MSYAKAKAKHDAGAGDGGDESRLMCSAHGCPNRWSTDAGFLCRWHAEAEPHRWPEVTEQMHWEITEQARRRGDPAGRHVTPTFAEKSALLLRLPEVLKPKSDRAWLVRLRARAASGEKLSAMQKHALHECRHIDVERAEA